MHATAGALLLAGAALAACSDTPGLAPRPRPTTPTPMAAASRYIIELRQPGTVPAALIAAIQADGGSVSHVHAGVGLVVAWHLSSESATAIARRPEVRAVIPDRTIQWLPGHLGQPTRIAAEMRPAAVVRGRGRAVARAAADPRTAFYFQTGWQWNMHVTRADSAWQISTQGAGVRVFILDTGADTAHQDLSGRFDGALSTSFVFTDAADTATVPFFPDTGAHGTFVSSIISSNSIGVAAVAPQATLVIVKVLDSQGTGSLFAVLQAMLYAADNGADVINLSLGGYLPANDPGSLAFADFMQRIADYAVRKGVVIVVAAGNDAVNTNTGNGAVGNVTDSINLPAALHHVISAGATAPINQVNFDRIASYSDFGKAGVTVFAPGGDFADPNPADTATSKFDLIRGACSQALAGGGCSAGQDFYISGAGTSFAAPHVAGEIAVIKSQSGFEIKGQALANCTVASADEVTGVRIDPIYGFGRIDILHGVTACHNGWSFVP